MSTDYILRSPLTLHEVERLTGWRAWKSDDGHGLTDGENFVHTDEDAEGRVTGYVRYGLNDPSGLEPLDVVSEHDVEDADYVRLFGGE
jgi:hypothetical protein